ncbi:MAG: Tryptophan synthase alpha chain [Verrucomicrobiae bacterium]|nr:Tryptophan synthase alpha chain [Verrucomicrobiae bacterium]
MNRIDQKFRALRTLGKKGFVAYIAAGDPNLKQTGALAREFERIGVDVLELGVPFSDPLADGVVNQLAAERALKSGTTLRGVLDLVRNLRRQGCEIPIVFYIYFNLVHRYGVKNFAKEACRAGVDGVLTLDLPPEEGAAFQQTLTKAGVHPIVLIAPTTPTNRIRTLVKQAGGFIYYISREGVTGMQSKVATTIRDRVAVIRQYSKLPVAIGFGISNPKQARAVAMDGDACVVGSAIVNQIAQNGRDAKKVARFVAPLIKEVKR